MATSLNDNNPCNNTQPVQSEAMTAGDAGRAEGPREGDAPADGLLQAGARLERELLKEKPRRFSGPDSASCPGDLG